jgi:hypothetical protein
MKKIIIASLLFIGTTIFAQESTPKQDKQNKEQMTPEQRQQKHLAHLTKELSLNTKQQEQVGLIISEKRAKIQDAKTQKAARKVSGDKMTLEEKAAFKTQMQAEKADTDTRMKNILSADQHQKWLVLQEKNKAKLIAKKEQKLD